MGLRLSPRDDELYRLFGESAAHVVAAAQELTNLLGSTLSARAEVVDRLARIECAADRTTHRIIRLVASSFVLPFDHDDVVDLAGALDDCTDAIHSAGDVVVLYRMGPLLTGCDDLVRVIVRMAELTAQAMPQLATRRELADYCVEINRLENQGDVIHRRLLGEIFGGRITDPLEVVKHKDMVDRLERAADAFERVAHRVESIAVKGT